MVGAVVATVLTGALLAVFVIYVGELFDPRAHRKRWWVR